MRRLPETSWYFGWNIVAAASILTLLTVGMRLSIGPFFLPMATDLELSRSLLGSIVALGMLCYGVGMIMAGALVSRFGTKATLLGGAVIAVLSAIWTVQASGAVSFTLAFGVFFSIGLALNSQVALTPILTRWFVRRRGMALFFLSTGSMAGIAVMTPVLTWFIEQYSWQQTLIGFAVIFTLLVLPTAIWVMDDNAPAKADAKPGSDSRPSGMTIPEGARLLRFPEALRTAPFWLVSGGMFACGFSMNLLGTHGVPMLMDHGFDATTSALGIGTIGLVAIFSTLVLGRLSDLWPRKYMLATIYCVRGLGFFALVLVGTHFELYGTAVIGGIVWAGSIALSSAILADVYGVRLVGVLYGLVYFIHQIGAALSAWLGGWGFEAFHTHWIAFGAAGGVLLLAGALSLCLPTQKQLLWRPAQAAAP